MKVVLFCGGLGLRLRGDIQNLPKPLAQIGHRPLLWHLMSYYARFWHHNFILCLGYRADAVKRYFLDYEETLSNDFVLRKGGRDISLLKRDIDDWTITFVDTGLHSNIGQRLLAVKEHIGDDEVFLANYSDGLSDLPLDTYVEHFLNQDSLAAFVSVVPSTTFHFVKTDENGSVHALQDVVDSGARINGGFFIFRREIFDYLNPNDDLVDGAFPRLIADGQLMAYRYDGFWQCMDTFKDYQALQELVARGDPPWSIEPQELDRVARPA